MIYGKHTRGQEKICSIKFIAKAPDSFPIFGSRSWPLISSRYCQKYQKKGSIIWIYFLYTQRRILHCGGGGAQEWMGIIDRWMVGEDAKKRKNVRSRTCLVERQELRACCCIMFNGGTGHALSSARGLFWSPFGLRSAVETVVWSDLCCRCSGGTPQLTHPKDGLHRPQPTSPLRIHPSLPIVSSQ